MAIPPLMIAIRTGLGYRGRVAAIATMHGKQRAVAPELRHLAGLDVVTATDIDTDALGTFTGEVPRHGTMLDAARAKARLAIETTGFSIGLGSEGSFGPHPSFPFVAGASELLVLIDAERGLEVKEFRRGLRTNYAQVTVTLGDDLTAFLAQVRFPSHALCAAPVEPRGPAQIINGIVDHGELSSVVRKLARQSSTGHVLLSTDMRAHVNPTRMHMIGRLARRLGVRLARSCPVCAAPGFGLVDVERGLPCASCEAPTQLMRAEIHGCARCDHRLRKRERPASARAEPGNCQGCNP
jgi:hypothetical protein